MSQWSRQPAGFVLHFGIPRCNSFKVWSRWWIRTITAFSHQNWKYNHPIQSFPFRKLGSSEQRKSFARYHQQVSRATATTSGIHRDDTRLILVEGAAGTGNQFYWARCYSWIIDAIQQWRRLSYWFVTSKRFLLVNNEDQMHVYDDMALKHGLAEKYGQCVSACSIH